MYVCVCGFIINLQDDGSVNQFENFSVSFR